MWYAIKIYSQIKSKYTSSDHAMVKIKCEQTILSPDPDTEPNSRIE